MSLLVTGASFHNIQSLEAQLIAAFTDWVDKEVNDDYMKEQFRTDKWPYNAKTRRKNGSTQYPGKRDIYDLGNLYRSGQRSFQIRNGPTEIVASWHWDATNSSGDEYAWYVHEGKGPHSIEPRPWTDEIAVPTLFYRSPLKKALEANITLKMSR
jgi:hypothetical protein